MMDMNSREEGPLPASVKAERLLDCVGLYCPMPVLKTREELDKLSPGQVLEVWADDPAAEEDLKAWARRTGHQILDIAKSGEGLRFLIRKIH